MYDAYFTFDQTGQYPYTRIWIQGDSWSFGWRTIRGGYAPIEYVFFAFVHSNKEWIHGDEEMGYEAREAVIEPGRCNPYRIKVTDNGIVRQFSIQYQVGEYYQETEVLRVGSDDSLAFDGQNIYRTDIADVFVRIGLLKKVQGDPFSVYRLTQRGAGIIEDLDLIWNFNDPKEEKRMFGEFISPEQPVNYEESTPDIPDLSGWEDSGNGYELPE